MTAAFAQHCNLVQYLHRAVLRGLNLVSSIPINNTCNLPHLQNTNERIIDRLLISAYTKAGLEGSLPVGLVHTYILPKVKSAHMYVF